MTEYVADKVIKSLKVRTQKSGAKTYYFTWYENAKTRRLSLGSDKELTIGQAREVARHHTKNLALGVSPSTRQSSVKGKATMADLYDSWVADIGCYKKSAYEDDRIWHKYCCDLHNIFVHELKQVDIKTTFDRVGAPTMANRVLALLGTLCRYAINSDEYDLSHNPCANIRRNRENKRDRYLTSDEIKRFIDRVKYYRHTRPDAACFLLLLALTGARKSEISNMRWCDVHGCSVKLRDHKTDRTGDVRVIQLPIEAQEILATLPKRSSEDYVLRIRNPRALFERVCTETQILNFRIHDLRHNFASIAVNLGMGLQEIGALLGHKSTQTTQRYAHLYEDRLQNSAQQIADTFTR